MTKAEQLQAFDEFTAKQRSILESKGDDYAGADRLANFRLAGGMANQGHKTPGTMAVLNQITNKGARLGQLLNSDSPPKNESIEDSIIDQANYCFLLRCVFQAETNG